MLNSGRSVGLASVCVIASGLLLNIYLAIVARSLSPAEYGYFGSFWSIALIVGFGFFLPVEQELARALQHQHSSAVLRIAMPVAVLGAAVECAIVLTTTPFLLRAFGGSVGVLAALSTLCLVSAGQFLVRGLLIGKGRLNLYGLLLVIDTFLRVLFAAVVWWALPVTSASFAWTLVLAIAVAHLPLLSRELGNWTFPLQPDTAMLRNFTRTMAPLLVGSIGGQILLNGLPVIVASFAAESQQDLAGRFAAAFFLARVPLFIVVPLQTTLVPMLTRLLSTEQPRGRISSIFARFAGALALAVMAGVIAAFTVGPWLVRTIFGPAYDMAGPDLALMAAGVVVHVGLIIATQALIAASMHAKVALTWMCGIAAAAVSFAVVSDLLMRAELAFLAGSLVGFVSATSFLLLGTTRQR